MNRQATAKRQRIDSKYYRRAREVASQEGRGVLRLNAVVAEARTDASDPDLVYLSERLHQYSEQLSDRLSSMKQALADGDADAWSAHAHAITDTTARLGAINMMKLCIALQMQGRRYLLAKARETFAELEAEFERFKGTLVTLD